MSEEIWKPVVGFESHYAVSSSGRVKRVKPGCKFTEERIVTQRLHNGYNRVNFSVSNCRTYHPTHRVVAYAFLGPRPEGYQINHIDGDRLNNAASNLEYVTPVENCHHAILTGLMKRTDRFYKSDLSKVREIRSRHTEFLKKLAGEYELSVRAVRRMVSGETWAFDTAA